MVIIKPNDIVAVFTDVREVAALAKALVPFIKQTIEEALQIQLSKFQPYTSRTKNEKH